MKKAISILLALTLLLTLAACGAAEPAVEATAEVTTQATTETTTEATEPTISEAERLYGLGMEALESGDANAAYEYFEAARAHDETRPFGWLGLAELLIRDYDFEGAEILLTEALEKTGNDPLIAEKLEMLHSASVSDSDGRILRANGFDGDGVLQYYIIHAYRVDGKPDSWTCYDAEGSQIGYIQMEYDDLGRATKEAVEYFYYDAAPCSLGWVEYVYDEEGNQAETYMYTPDGALDNSTRNTYNEAGLIVCQISYLGTEVDRIQHYTYDPQGRLERVDSCDANDKLENYVLWSYDEAGHCIERCYYYADGMLFRREVLEYDENGILQKIESYDGSGELMEVRVLEHD